MIARMTATKHFQKMFEDNDVRWRYFSYLTVGRSCQQGCRTVDRSPPGGLQLQLASG